MTNDRDVAYYHKRHKEDGQSYSKFCRLCGPLAPITEDGWASMFVRYPVPVNLSPEIAQMFQLMHSPFHMIASDDADIERELDAE